MARKDGKMHGTHPRQVYTIQELYIYPIKSCRGIKLSEANLGTEGLQYDRQWMLVDQNMNFLTIRQEPRLTQIQVELNLARLQGTMSIYIAEIGKVADIPSNPGPIHLASWTERKMVHIWSNHLMANVYHSRVTRRISEFLERPVYLALKDTASVRKLQGNGREDLYGRPGSVGFADVLPILVTSRASLQDVNSKMAEIEPDFQAEMRRFRANIVVDGVTPWEEDNWKTIVLCSCAAEGKLVVDVVARCARCQVPNVNPMSGSKHPREPWSTLMSYRRIDDGIKYKPCFGMLGIPRSERILSDEPDSCLGRVRVGDKLVVEETTEQHRYHTGF